MAVENAAVAESPGARSLTRLLVPATFVPATFGILCATVAARRLVKWFFPRQVTLGGHIKKRL
jgi:hypothetical protein